MVTQSQHVHIEIVQCKKINLNAFHEFFLLVSVACVIFFISFNLSLASSNMDGRMRWQMEVVRCKVIASKWKYLYARIAWIVLHWIRMVERCKYVYFIYVGCLDELSHRSGYRCMPVEIWSRSLCTREKLISLIANIFKKQLKKWSNYETFSYIYIIFVACCESQNNQTNEQAFASVSGLLCVRSVFFFCYSIVKVSGWYIP